MKVIDFMFKHIKFVLIIVIIGFLVACSNSPALATPFEIRLTQAQFACEEDYPLEDNPSSTQNSNLRLKLSLEINNTSRESLKNVWYEFQLNEEAKPYIASQMLGLKSDPMNLVSEEQFLSASKDAHLAWGFVSHWSPLITSPKTLEEFHSLRLTDIYKAIQYVDVTVHWDGGTQAERLKIDFSPEDLSLIQSLESQ